MFEKDLSERFKRIFDLDKVTYDRPGESMEQEAAFIEIESARCRVKDARQLARVQGVLRVFASLDKLPYGYLSKHIAAADALYTQGLFFYEFEENKGTFRNIVERTMKFIFLFDSQFDPAIGTITSLDLSITETL